MTGKGHERNFRDAINVLSPEMIGSYMSVSIIRKNSICTPKFCAFYHLL